MNHSKKYGASRLLQTKARAMLVLSVASVFSCGRKGSSGSDTSSLTTDPQTSAAAPQDIENPFASLFDGSKHLRPNLINASFDVGVGNNGMALSSDGRVRISTAGIRDNLAGWFAYAVRPEAVSLDNQGLPNRESFKKLFSPRSSSSVSGNGENGISLCSTNPYQPFRVEGSSRVYEFDAYDSDMENVHKEEGQESKFYRVFRKRKLTVQVLNPDTRESSIGNFAAGPFEFIKAADGSVIRGIEPSVTHDGQLMIFQGGSSNGAHDIDHIMYTFNDKKCALDGWSKPQPIHKMHSDPRVNDRYLLAKEPLRAADGSPYTDQHPVRGAYPWVDAEGRNVLFMSVIAADNARRSGAVYLGADTRHTTYLMDSGINSSTNKADLKLFYSSPMWNFERDRPGSEVFPQGKKDAFRSVYLPISRIHDVLPLIGSNTSDYTELDLSELADEAHVAYLPMTQLVDVVGQFQDEKTPDLSELHNTARLIGKAEISKTNWQSSLLEPHSVGGYAKFNNGSSTIEAELSSAKEMPGLTFGSAGFTVQVSVFPRSAGQILEVEGKWSLRVEADSKLCFWGSTSFAAGPAGEVCSSGNLVGFNRWTHLALVFDGYAKELRFYANGVFKQQFALQSAAPMVRFRLLGDRERTTLRAGGNGFTGNLDNVILTARARTARSICMTAAGAQCADESVSETANPQGAQFKMDAQETDCALAANWGSTACVRAAHRVCASQGLWQRIKNEPSSVLSIAQALVNGKAPVSMAGIYHPQDGKLRCFPEGAETYPISFEELQDKYNGTCRRTDQITSAGCMDAAVKFCKANGFVTGFAFEQTARAWVACYGSTSATLTEDAPGLGSCQPSSLLGGACLAEVNNRCGEKAGYVTIGSDGKRSLTCFNKGTALENVFTSPESIVEENYQTYLGRNADESGRQFYVTNIRSLGSFAAVERGLRNSDEAKIRSLYVRYLRREPDQGGMNNYLSQLRNGISLAQIEAAIRDSDEAQGKVAAAPANNPVPVSNPSPVTPEGQVRPIQNRNILNAGESLRPGAALTSANGIYTFVFQSDGNACVYKQGLEQSLWCSMSHDKGAANLVLQYDGNLVAYTSGNASAVWASGPVGNYPRALLAMQDDGNLVIYTNDANSRPIWASNTGGR